MAQGSTSKGDDHGSGVRNVGRNRRFAGEGRVEPAAGKTKVSQTVEVKGPLGPVMGGMMGPQVSKEFGTLLENLARKAEAS